MKYIIWALVALLILLLTATVVTAANVVVVDTPQYTGTLKVESLPTQPSLKVVNGESVVYEDGTVNWQPAGSLKLQ